MSEGESSGRVRAGLVLLLCFWLPTLQAEERIVEFLADIAIEADGGVLVTERLTVESEARSIVRGIFRDIPTEYHDAQGRAVSVAFTLLETRRDGAPEPNRVQRLPNGYRIWLGSASVTLPAGRHRYELRYRSGQAVGFFEQHDELYWNVTGNDWAFPIESASAHVRLPAGAAAASQLKAEAYTGLRGAQGRDWRVATLVNDGAVIEATRRLEAHEGLTIVLSFPKGLVQPPAPTTSAAAAPWLAPGALFAVLVYYLLAWRYGGRDPQGGPLYPRYEGPATHTPGELRVLREREHDIRAFVADLVNLAARGVITITRKPREGPAAKLLEDAGQEWQLKALPGRTGLARCEEALLETLFTSESTDLGSAHAFQIRTAILSHAAVARKRVFDTLYRPNRAWLWPGALMSVAALVAIGAARIEDGGARWIMLVVPVLWFAVVLGARGVQAFLDLRSDGRHLAALLRAIATLVLVGGSMGWGAVAGAALHAPVAVACALALVPLNLVFFVIMKAYTAQGRALLDEAEGLRLYLSLAEMPELAREREPPLDAARYQKLLPWAIALDVEEAWAGKLQAIAGEHVAQVAQGAAVRSALDLTDFVRVARSSARASFIQRSSSRSWSGSPDRTSLPSSRSGSGGMGRSGGGGGGGGGGGW